MSTAATPNPVAGSPTGVMIGVVDHPHARRPRLAGPPRGERLRRERTARDLRRRAALERDAEAGPGAGPGPAGGPVGEPARAAWRRRQADAYLALPPWARAWRTWRSWGPLRRALAVLAVAIAWTVAALPLRAGGIATYRTSEIGFALIVALAPVLAALPPHRRGRFADPIPVRPGGPWGRGRQALILRRAGRGAVLAGAGVLTWLVATGPGVDEHGLGRKTTAHHLADGRTVREAVARVCPGAAPARLTWLGGDRYRADLTGGGRLVVDAATGRPERPVRC
jgi:hypothetical protein